MKPNFKLKDYTVEPADPPGVFHLIHPSADIVVTNLVFGEKNLLNVEFDLNYVHPAASGRFVKRLLRRVTIDLLRASLKHSEETNDV